MVGSVRAPFHGPRVVTCLVRLDKGRWSLIILSVPPTVSAPDCQARRPSCPPGPFHLVSTVSHDVRWTVGRPTPPSAHSRRSQSPGVPAPPSPPVSGSVGSEVWSPPPHDCLGSKAPSGNCYKWFVKDLPSVTDVPCLLQSLRVPRFTKRRPGCRSEDWGPPANGTSVPSRLSGT